MLSLQNLLKNLNDENPNNDYYALDVSNRYEAALFIFLVVIDVGLFFFICLNIKKINLWGEDEEVNKSKLLCINANLLLMITGLLFSY